MLIISFIHFWTLSFVLLIRRLKSQGSRIAFWLLHIFNISSFVFSMEKIKKKEREKQIRLFSFNVIISKHICIIITICAGCAPLKLICLCDKAFGT